MWIGQSVFRPVLHRIGDTALTILLDRVRYWWAVCGDMCEALQGNENPAVIPPCPLCFPCGLDPALSTRPPEFMKDYSRGAPDTVPDDRTRDEILDERSMQRDVLREAAVRNAGSTADTTGVEEQPADHAR